MSILSSPVALALMSGLMYGIGSPLIKIVSQNGVSSSAMTLSFGAALIALAFLWPGNSIAFGSSKALAICSITGIILAFGFVFAVHAFAQPTGYVSLVVALIAIYPLISVGVEIGFMNVQLRSVLGVVGGAALIVAGGIAVTLSVGGNA